ncbi:MAG: isoleucine--tRNA ligase [Bacilli bacterium]|nr:isoleucine--tRNA ligase [Bacilli bacterium]
MKFNELLKDKNSVVEEKIASNWQKMDILDKTIKNRDNNDYFVFYDGPATANGMPGIHHMLSKLLKDVFCKYKTMQGYKVLRKVGWDTHGLPVEVQVEKELGFSGKKDIEAYGIKEFNEKCRESVWVNEKAFRDFTVKMGQFINLDDPYVTYDNNYIETEWWILKKFFDEGLIYDGLKITPYCPRCGTTLASHEVAQGYKEISVNTVTVPFKLKDEENTYLLVWTTTPWTLMSNVAACVNPNELYVKCLSKGHNFIVAKKLANKVLGDDYEVISEYTGKDLEYREYEQLMPILEVNKKAFYVTCADYVTMEDGTGIVHIAPAFGQDDYEVGLKYDLPVLNPVDEEGKYKSGPWTGRLVVDSELEIDIIKYLAGEDKLFKKQKMEHNYPHCWRCNTPLLYYSKPSLYIKTTAIQDKIIEENNKVNWYPSFIGEKRFGNWLENMNDWAISRNRYWGTPIPLWRCSCGHMEMIGSRSELVEKAIEKIDESIELHRPYVDDIHVKCNKCGNTMNRVTDVMDCWFDSGAMPFAQYHYPFENKELFEKQFPADFISEGIDQTRGWFYSLMVISTFVMGKSPYKNVLVNDLVLDKFGHKMHKSKGNSLSPFNLIEEFGSDTIRWYFPYASPVWTPIKFDEEGLKEVYSKFFNTLKNTYSFFALYANTDGIDPREFSLEYDKLEEIDKWLLSKYNRLLEYVTSAYDVFDLNKVVRSITDFVNEDLSNWYIRRNRRRFWRSELDDSKMAVYQTTYEVLVGLTKMIAPIASFTAEEIYTNLTGLESVHLADFPKVDSSLLNNEIETKMELVRNLISLGRNAREEVKIKVRQPISEVILDGKNKDILFDLVELIEEELNVKEVNFVDDLSIYMNFEVKPNFKVCGPMFGPNIGLLSKELLNLNVEQIKTLEAGNTLDITVNGSSYTINNEMIDVRISSKEGFNASSLNNDFIILNTTLTEDLINEGIVREFISKVQQLRKNKDFDIVDRINIYYQENLEFDKAIDSFIEIIKEETLCVQLIKKENSGEVYNLNGIDVIFDIEKI